MLENRFKRHMHCSIQTLSPTVTITKNQHSQITNHTDQSNTNKTQSSSSAQANTQKRVLQPARQIYSLLCLLCLSFTLSSHTRAHGHNHCLHCLMVFEHGLTSITRMFVRIACICVRMCVCLSTKQRRKNAWISVS